MPEVEAPPPLDAEGYRAHLMEEIVAGDPRLQEALRLIRTSLDAVSDPFDREHLATHVIRWLKSIAMMPDGPGRLIDIGSLPHYTAALTATKGWRIETVEILAIDYERDALPYGDESVDAVMLCEVIEHFVLDPLHCLNEINRILRPGGAFLVTTPNTASWFAVYQALNQKHPFRWPVYSGNPMKSRHHIHAREYTCGELRLLLEAAGFDVEAIETLDYGLSAPLPPIAGFDSHDRGDTIFAVCRKAGAPRYRFIQPIYLETEVFSGYSR